uniref:Uncharacterized protein n=1 Tax=Rhizophora mucronata TaxID=61149 RepID=A0A2P2NJ85_RHIMU
MCFLANQDNTFFIFSLSLSLLRAHKSANSSFKCIEKSHLSE